MGACLITGKFKATLAQSLNFEVYLTPIGFELDKKKDQIAAYLWSGPLYHILSQSWFTYLRQIFILLEIFEKHYAKGIDNNIYKIESKLAYIKVLWWQCLAIDIPNSNKKTIQLYNQYLALKPLLEKVAYTDGSGINKKISFSFIVQGKSKAIKKFLGAHTYNIVYMKEL